MHGFNIVGLWEARYGDSKEAEAETVSGSWWQEGPEVFCYRLCMISYLLFGNSIPFRDCLRQ